MPQKHIDQLNHNCDFHGCICEKYPEKFYDWKITVLFYAALHCVKAYFKNKNIEIGDTHNEIEKSINPNIHHAPYKVNKGCWHHYKSLYRYSQSSRYEGIADASTFEKSLLKDHEHCLEHLDAVKKYVIAQGLPLDSIAAAAAAAQN